jgi:predicted transcriptional regulator
MEKVNVTFRMNKDRVALLDKLGNQLDRDRSYLVNQAVSDYLALQQWQLEEIERAIEEADAGKFVTDAQVREAFRDFRK